MSDYTTKATAVLSVNGEQAKSEIPKLKKLIVDLEVAVNNAAKAGNKPLLKNLKKELKEARKQLKDFESAAQAAEYVMQHLDKATPKQLSAALRQLKKELNDIERGSAAWNQHVEKIKRVQRELDMVNKQMKQNESLWSRFSKSMFQWGNALMVLVGTFTGLVMSGRRAVNAFAEMDQEMANVRKYTGMAEEQVEALNEEFKKMDTRSSRQQLNKLAQEAGRLGMQSQEDVMGFVRASDKINVALDELGDGATLTLSKLTNIFGDRERLGVEKSLLAVGSVINELSQNSTAAAPYLTEFASRLGGVGAQAHMTTQQIMGYGAVLDSYNQKVEASSTALSQVIVRLYREPAKYAKVAGLDVKEFTDLLKNDANAALLQFLEALHNAGGMDVLSPMFADMGENGARAIQALATLATHIDEVKAQQAAANQAFEEAVSIDKEYNVQNNTVQAQLEKAKKRFNELAITLGEKLMPVMRYAITSSSAMMRVLSIIVDFFVEYKGVIVIATAGLIAHTVAVKGSELAFKAQYYWMVLTEGIMRKSQTVLLALKMAWFALTNQVEKARAAYTAFHLLTKTTPWGMLIGAITAVVAALYMFTKRTKEASQAQKEFNKLSDELAESRKRYMDRLDQETSKIKFLAAAARDETATLESRHSAIRQLNAIIPNYCARLDDETGKYYENKAALDEYLKSLEKKIRLEANRAEYERLIQEDERLSREIKYDEDATREVINRSMGGATSREQREAIAHAWGAGMDPSGKITYVPLSGKGRSLQEQRALVRRQLKQLMDYAEGVDVLDEGSEGGGGGGGYTPAGGSGSGGRGGSSGKPDKFAAEKAWRERELALNKIAWLTGKQDYESYTEGMLEIEAEYHKKRLAHQDLEGNERVTIQAEYLEAQKKQQEQYDKWTVEEENQAYEDLKRQIQEDYLQKRITTESYNMQMENIEMAHMRALTYITREGTTERAKAEKEYRDRMVKDQLKKQQEYEAAVKKHQDELAKVYDEYYFTDKEQKDKRYAEMKKLIEEVYNAELAKVGDNEEKKNEINKRHAEALKKLYKEIYGEAKDQDKSLEEWIGSLLDKLFGEGTWEKYGAMIKSMWSSIASVYDSLNKMAEADNEIRMARLEKYYEREISMAEGNAYKVQQIERKKKKEEAKLKAEASKRQFAQQVISAVAETALAAIRAYATAPAPTMIWGPIAAAMAVAAGGIQIAAIKKQQAASLAQGYSRGGFTPDGRVDEPVGIVHAGEWVASQKLLKNPTTRAAIEALDYAQRNNTIGRLSAADVSRSVTAPAVLAGAAGDETMQRTMEAMVAVMARYGETMSRLGDRLDEPFVTINTVTGPMGTKQAQDDYQKMMNNTLPKNKRK